MLRCLPTSYIEAVAREKSVQPNSKSYEEWMEQLSAMYNLDSNIITGFFGWLGNFIKGLTVSFVARNPFIVWKNLPNIDPDSGYNTSGMGLEYGSLPSRRSYGFNVNLKF